MTPWTLRALLIVYESAEPVPKELVIFEAGKLIPPAQAYRVREKDRKRLSPNKVKRTGLSQDFEFAIDMGRRRMLHENLNELTRKGRLEVTIVDGVVLYQPGSRPYLVEDLQFMQEDREEGL